MLMPQFLELNDDNPSFLKFLISHSLFGVEEDITLDILEPRISNNMHLFADMEAEYTIFSKV